MTTVLATLFVLGVLVFIHELGHFMVAKLLRIRVDRFSIGYPPRLIGKKIGDTDYCISAIPFGGYVKIAGMLDESLDKKQLEGAPKPWEYRSRPWIQKALVVLAGPLMNLVLAFVISVSTILYYGIPEISSEPIVGSVIEGKPAEEIGIRPGDRIVTLNGVSVHSWEQMADIIHNVPGEAIEVKWLRRDTLYAARVTTTVDTLYDVDGAKKVGLIGIGPEFHMKGVGVWKAVIRSGETGYYITKLIFITIAKLIVGKESLRSLAGPVAIARMAGESARSGLGTLIGFMALLSLNLGILNLLPIPVLDGGHLMFLSIEGLLRKQIPVKTKLIIQQIGMILLLGLMLFVIYNDILRWLHK